MPHPVHLSSNAIRVMTLDDYRRLNTADTLVLDLRRPADFVHGHIENAFCHPGTRFGLRHSLPALVAGRPVIMVVQGLLDVDLMMQEMVAIGVEIVGLLSGTPKSWASRDLPIIGWSALSRADWARQDPKPLVVNILERSETDSETWPESQRHPLSQWGSHTVPFDYQHGVVVVGPTDRATFAAMQLFHVGCRRVYHTHTATAIGMAPVGPRTLKFAAKRP